jgi:tetratricopeptide (TPR) repeat protein
VKEKAAPNHRLLRIITEAGISYESLARMICQVAVENGDRQLRANKSSVAHWTAGTRPQPRTAAYLVEALSRRLGRTLDLSDLGLSGRQGPAARDNPTTDRAELPDDPVTAVERLGRADVDRRTLLTGTVYSIGALVLPLRQREPTAETQITTTRIDPPRPAGLAGGRGPVAVGAVEVQAVRDMIVAFNAADERLGGGHARSAVVEYLATDVTTYLRGRFATGKSRQAMFGAAAQLAYLAGWKAHDLGLPGLAQRYYLHSYQLACESDPHAHAAYGLRILTHQAMDLGRDEHCVDLAEAALGRSTGRVDADTESLFWLTLARAHAVKGARREALVALSHAERLISRARSDDVPQWASLGGPAEARLSNQSAKTLLALGDLPAAEQLFRRAARCWDARTHPRVHALTMAELAQTQCAQGHVEQACETWTVALNGMTGVRSARIRDAVRSMRQHLAAYSRRGLGAARRLESRAASLLS